MTLLKLTEELTGLLIIELLPVCIVLQLPFVVSFIDKLPPDGEINEEIDELMVNGLDKVKIVKHGMYMKNNKICNTTQTKICQASAEI